MTTCIMAGCEYLNSIDRVGLKRVLGDYKKAGSCEKVVEALLKNKAMKDRVPEGYFQNVQKVKTIFRHQTVYNPKEKKFVPIFEPKEGEVFD